MPTTPAGLTLYQTLTCPYCAYVRDAAAGLGLALAARDTGTDDVAHEELFAARGRGTVPVLRIEHPGGRVEWMPESRDIVRYLRARFATTD